MEDTWGIIISGVLAAGTILGVVLSGIGKKGDQEQAQVTDQFKRMLEEVNYWQTTTARQRTEWEDRWDRQVKRCRTIIDKLVVYVGAQAAMLSDAQDDPGIQREAQRLLREVEEHLAGHDHLDHHDR